jgi:hypothetical protein
VVVRTDKGQCYRRGLRLGVDLRRKSSADQEECPSCLDKNMHTTVKTKDELKCRLFLDVVIRESSTIFKLLSGEDALVVGRGTGNDDQHVLIAQ